MNKEDLKVGDRVKLVKSVYGLEKGDEATIMELNDVSAFVNTDRPNYYNHFSYDGNGLILNYTSIALLSRAGGWTAKDVDYLHTFYRRKSVTKIAEALGKTYYAVQSKAKREGIHKHPRREYNKADNSYICHATVDNVPPVTIANNLHRGKQSLMARLSLMQDRKMLPVLPSKEA